MKHQYRQSRAFSTLEGAHFESAKNNMLRVWFKNARGYYLISFPSEAESTTIMNICNIIVNNEDYHLPLDDQVTWAGYVVKKNKGYGSNIRFLLIRKDRIELYNSHQNWENGEKPSKKFSLLRCDFSQKAGA